MYGSTWAMVTMTLGQIAPALPVVVAFVLARRRMHWAPLAIVTFLAYLVVSIASTSVLLGVFDLGLMVRGAYNLLSSYVMPIAWTVLSILWTVLFTRFRPSR